MSTKGYAIKSPDGELLLYTVRDLAEHSWKSAEAALHRMPGWLAREGYTCVPVTIYEGEPKAVATYAGIHEGLCCIEWHGDIPDVPVGTKLYSHPTGTLALLREAEGLLRRYRKETPLGHQPHMIAHVVDDVLKRIVAALKEAGE